MNTQFQLDPLGRLKQQIVQPNSHNKADPAVLIGRRYQYDTIGNLVRTDDQTNGSRDYTYDALGRITQSADEHYRYDPAHNLTDGSRISGNRLTQYKGTSYRYDPLGNLIEKQQHDGEIQHYRYNADNQLAEAEIHRPGQNAVLYRYRYDPIGRRIAKVHPDGNEIQYLWDGSRLLQEYRKDRTYTYVYTEDQNYELLAQITTYNGSDKAREILYYHNDQIGIPREMTDEEGNIVWSGDYSGWGKLTQEGRLKLDIHQPFRLQNQHYDEETGLHYNFFRYYDPEIGRFTQQDPIRLMGGENLYHFAPNAQSWVDLLGLSPFDDRPDEGLFDRETRKKFWGREPVLCQVLTDRWNSGAMKTDLINGFINNATGNMSNTAAIATPSVTTKARPGAIPGALGIGVNGLIGALDPNVAQGVHVLTQWNPALKKCQDKFEPGQELNVAQSAEILWRANKQKEAMKLLRKHGCVK